MKKRLLPITILASLGVAALAGCGESGGGGGGGGSVIDVTGVTLNKTSASLFVGGTEQLVATIAPADATDKAVTWSSADKNVVTVDANGLVAAVGVGETAVTVTTNDGAFKASCDFTVTLDMKSLTITNKAAFADGLEEESSASVSVSGDPAFNATVLANKGYLTVTSSNKEVATTSKLMINALKAGTTTITASLFGKSDSFELTVTEKPVIDVNYGTAESPLGIATALTEVAKLGLENKGYSPKPFYISGKISAVLAPASQSGYIFSISDDTNKMDVSSCLLEDGKTADDYGLTDVVTILGYLRADSSKSGGYYLSYNNGAATGTSSAPQIIAWQKGEGGEEVPEPAVTERTLAEFIAGENTKAVAYLVSGEIKAFKSGATKDTYGNMTLTDGTNDLIIYGATMDATRLVWNKVDAYSFSNPQDFMSNETTNALNIGDTVKMKLIRCDYVTESSTKIEGQGIIVDITPGGGGEEVPEPAVVERSLAEFIAGENTKAVAYLVSGEIKAFKSGATKDKYGNMTLTDGTNDLIIYGATMTATALAWDKVSAYSFENPQDFMTNATSNALNIGDTVKMKLIRCDYVTESSTKIEGQGIIVDITPGGGGGGEEVPEPAVTERTLAEFIAGENTKAKAYLVTGEIKSFKNGDTKDKYGNMYLTDGTNDLQIYGATVTESALVWNKADAYSFENPQDFMTNETTNALKVGDTVTMKLIRCDYVTESSTKIEGQGIITDIQSGEGGGGEDVDAVQLVPGTNGSAYKVKAGDTTYEGVKVGTGSKVGDMTIKVPATATKVTLHAAAWNGKAAVLTVTAENATVDKASLTLVSDSGIAGTANPFVLAADESTYVCVLNLSNVTGAVSIKLATTDTANGRFVVWNVVAE